MEKWNSGKLAGAYTGFLVELHLPVDCDGAQREISTIPSDAKNFTFAYL